MGQANLWSWPANCHHQEEDAQMGPAESVRQVLDEEAEHTAFTSDGNVSNTD